MEAKLTIFLAFDNKKNYKIYLRVTPIVTAFTNTLLQKNLKSWIW